MATLDRISTSYPLRLSNELKKKYKDYKENYKGELHFRQFMLRHIFTDPLYGMGDSSMYRGILVYHETGTGKTRVGASILLSLIDIRPTVVLLPKSLQHGFTETIKYLVQKESFTKKDYSSVMQNVKFVAADAYNADKQILTQGTLDNKLLIVDEAHNLFRGIINSSSEDTIAYKIYKLIMEASNLRIVFLTGTPITKDPFELVPCFNMLTGVNLLPYQYDSFYRYFVSGKSKMINKNKFQNRIFGLVSCITLSEKTHPDDDIKDLIKKDGGYPEDLGINLVKLEMSEIQYTRYMMIRFKEDRSRKKSKSNVDRYVTPLTLPSGNKKSSYFVGSRQASNFSGPLDIAPENLSEEHLNEESSPKMSKIVEMSKELEGLIIVYSQFSGVGGLEILARYLNKNGYTEYTSETIEPGQRYAIFTGNVDMTRRTAVKVAFTSPKNTHGDIIKLLLISSVAAEGIDLKCVRHVIIHEPYWYWSRIQQVIARAKRLGSHDRLPVDKRNFKTYILISTANKKVRDTMTDKEPYTIDERFYKMSLEKRDIIDEFTQALKESSLECIINGYKECRMCVPDNNMLFNNPNDISIDMELVDPCKETSKSEVSAKEITYKDEKYYYIEDKDAVFKYKIFKYNKDMEGYVEIEVSSPLFMELLKIIKK